MTKESIALWKAERTKTERIKAERRKANRRSLREDIEVGPESGSGKTAKVAHLTLVQDPESGSENDQKVGPRN